MIFSNKITRIVDGKNASLFCDDKNTEFVYILNKSLKKYKILSNLNRNCVFCDNYNAQKIIELNNNNLAVCSNDFITILNKDEL